MTYRERREARADKLREWAGKREEKATAALTSHPETRHDHAFLTQPGHIPARARMIRADDRAHESLRKAESMTARAASIEAQAAGAIYSDDDDAIPALQARLDRLEGERDRVKAYNASCRKIKGDVGDLSLLDEKQQKDLLSAMRHAPIPGKHGAFPSYHLTNLSGNIKRNRDRLDALQAAAERDQ